MNNQDILAKKIVSALDAGLADLRPETVHKLQLARERACSTARQRTYSQIHNGHSLALLDKLRLHRVGIVGLVLMLLLFAGFALWQSNMIDNDDTATIDTELLTGDLPVNAYLDGHIGKWVSNGTE
ncbi:MAG: DUF3619 family protein [Sulfuriferula sp.]|nr:DUF3619 family protein [Sulfuriferula sp.]